MTTPDINDLVSRLSAAFIPEKAVGVDADIQFNLSGSRAGTWYATIKDQKLDLHEGASPSPKLTLTANSDDLINIFTGKMDGMQAFIQGKIRIAGDMSLAMKLMGMFKMK